MTIDAPDHPTPQAKSEASGAEANPSPAEAWAEFLRTRAPGPFRVIEEPEAKLLIKRANEVSER